MTHKYQTKTAKKNTKETKQVFIEFWKFITLIKLKIIKTNAAGIEKNMPIFNEINNSLENWLVSFVALDFESEVNRVVPKAIPIIPKGNWATLSAK